MATTFGGLGATVISLIRGITSATQVRETAGADLATGRRVRSARDDASSLAIISQMEAELRGLRAADRAASDGLSMLRTAEEALGQGSERLARMQELAVQAGNGALSEEDRAAIQEEFSLLRDDLTSLASTTEFNGTKLLDGSATDVEIQVGTGAGDTLHLPTGDLRPETLGIEPGRMVSDLDLSTEAGAREAMEVLGAAQRDVWSMRAENGATDNRLAVSVRSLRTVEENVMAARSRIEDTDVASAASLLVQSAIRENTGIAALLHANLNAGSALALLEG